MDFAQNVRATLLYFDIFDHPLTADELFRFLPCKIPRAVFDAKLDSLPIRSDQGLYHLRTDGEIAALRRRRERKAISMIRASYVVGWALRHFPYVRGVYLSGSLSKRVNDGSADIDLFIVTQENRLWLCRAILTLFKKLFLLNGKKFLCLNYFVSESHLQIPDRNVFVATEMVTLLSLYNRLELFELLHANEWILHFYPNFSFDEGISAEKRSTIQRFFEKGLNDGIATKLDGRLLKYFSGVWIRRYAEVPEEKRSLMFRSTRDSSKVHPNDFQSSTLDAYEKRLKLEKLNRITRIDD